MEGKIVYGIFLLRMDDHYLCLGYYEAGTLWL